jgi:hypothetical protein
MLAYTLRRLAQAAALVLVVATLVAVFIHLIPGDPVYVILGENNVTPERVAAVRAELGLDRPLPIQYADWLGGVARGDFGDSLTSRRPIGGDLLLRLPRTLELILVSTLLSVAVGIPLGVLAATNRNRLPDLAVSTVALVGVSAPVFVVGTLLLLVFGVRWGILPCHRLRRLRRGPAPPPPAPDPAQLHPGDPGDGRRAADDSLLDARSAGRGLCPDGPRQGARRPRRPLRPRPPQRPDPGPHDHRRPDRQLARGHGPGRADLQLAGPQLLPRDRHQPARLPRRSRPSSSSSPPSSSSSTSSPI